MRPRDQFPRRRKQQPNRPPQENILDEFTEGSIGSSKKATEALGKYHWDFYGDLAIQRYRVLPKIKEALLEASNKEYPIKNWQRAVKWKWSHSPLSARGSLSDPGGRFNIGDIDTTRFPPFQGLYIASDKETALQEILTGPPVIAQAKGNLSGYDFALTNPASITIVSVSGHIESVINLESGKSLKKFVDIIKDFEIDKELFERAKVLNEPPPSLIQTADQLVRASTAREWQHMPMFFDIPAPAQIFGQLAFETGIGGIVYPSIHTGKSCIVVFPKNLKGTGSYIQLDDTPPSDDVQRRIDAQNWQSLHD